MAIAIPDYIVKSSGRGAGPNGSAGIPDYIIKSSGSGAGPNGAIGRPDYIIKAGSPLPVTLIASVTAFSPNNGPRDHITSAGINTTGATLLVMARAGFAFGITGNVVDSKANTWLSTIDPQQTVAAPRATSIVIQYSINPTVGPDHTFSLSGATNQDQFMMVFAFGKGQFAFDKQAGSSVSPGSAVHPGSLTPAEAHELFITAASDGDFGITLGIDSGFTIQASRGFDDGTNGEFHFGGAFAWKQQNGPAAAEDPAWSISPATNVPAVIGCFRVS